MSKDWNIHCLDCGETHTFLDANHRDTEMATLCRHAAAIAALAPLFEDPGLGFWELELQTPEGRIRPGWFAKHAGHRLVPIDEYGGFLTQCPIYVTCVCGTPRRCTLDRDHAGDHDPTERRPTSTPP